MKQTPRTIVAVIAGVVLGAILGGAFMSAVGPPTREGSRAAASAWTCSMHPQVRLPRPGRCPICGMELVPVNATEGQVEDPAGAPAHLKLGEHARKMASVETQPIEERELTKEIRTVGRVAFDETRLRHITARVGGRVERVFADFPGTPVKQGDHLLNLYSPEIISTQEELLASRRREGETRDPGAVASASLAASARERLRRWGMTDEQLDLLTRTGKVETGVIVYSPLAGTVIEKGIREGQYVKEGDSLYTIADLSNVWLLIEVYESELAWVRFGQAVEVTLESEPGRVFRGTVGFVEPIVNDATRTVRVRVVLRNDDGRLKPGMYAQALLRIGVLQGGIPGPTGIEGKYVCPMHPFVAADAEGSCPVCQMPLEKIPDAPGNAVGKEPARVLAVPVEAVLSTGRRSIVYVEVEPGEFRPAEAKLGPRAGDYYPVVSGLEKGMRVVTRGSFLLDSQFQITGKPSLFYPEGISGGGTGHAGHTLPAGAPPGSSGSQSSGSSPAPSLPQPRQKNPEAQADHPGHGTGR